MLISSPDSTVKGHALGASVVVDNHDASHLAYIDVGTRTLNYALRGGSKWKTETVDYLVSAGSDRDHIVLKIDSTGQPHLVYCDSGLGVLKYASRDDNGWTTETIDDDEAGDYASLWLDENDQPYISYSALADKQLRIAHRVSPSSLTRKSAKNH